MTPHEWSIFAGGAGSGLLLFVLLSYLWAKSIERIAKTVTDAEPSEPDEPSTLPRRFLLMRDVDVSGVSDTGRVVEGVRFSDGWVTTHWLDRAPMWAPKTSVWHNKGTLDPERIHGHNGATRLVWLDDPEPPTPQDDTTEVLYEDSGLV